MHMWLPQHSLFLFLIPSGQFLLAALNEFPQLGHCEQPDSWLILESWYQFSWITLG